MAKPIGPFQFSGSLGDYTVVHSKVGTYIRRKGGISKDRIYNDPHLIRIRENNNEFGNVSNAAKLIRKTWAPIKSLCNVTTLNPRLMQLLFEVKKFDDTSPRGQRRVSKGLVTAQGKALLIGFELGIAKISNILQKSWKIDPVTHAITIDKLNPELDILWSKGTNVAILKAYRAVLDVDQNKGILLESNEVQLSANQVKCNVQLGFDEQLSQNSIHITVLTLTFYQLINEIMYPFNNQSRNVAEIVDVF